MKISASIYSNKNKPLADIITELDKHQVDMFHIDCNDDLSVFEDIKTIRKISKTPIDLHIISNYPEKYFSVLEKTAVEYLTFQYENLSSKLEIPKSIHSKIGLCISSDTPVNVFETYNHLDFILIMATTPGKSGGIFDKKNFDKIKKFRRLFPSKNIHVDGGVNAEVSFILRNMGVYASVSGSYLFNDNSLSSALLNLKLNDVKSHYQVKDFMKTIDESPTHLVTSDNLLEVLKSIEKGGLGFTMVVDEENNFKGIISNADIRKGLINNFSNINQMKISEITNKNPVSIREENTVEEMIQLIKSKNFPITYLPVINNDKKAVGVVTFVNLIKGEL